MKKNLFKENIIIGIILASLIIGCSEPYNNCLPYEGEIFDFGNPCSGIVLKVTNKDINSWWSVGDTLLENVIGIRFQQDITQIDSMLINKKIYFDFRDLGPDEIHPCPSLWSSPTRIVFVTNYALTQCLSTD